MNHGEFEMNDGLRERKDLQNHEARVTQAADWLLRLRDSAVAPAEIAEWLTWCNAAPENRLAYERMQALWNQTSRLKRRPVRTARRNWQTGLAVAAALGLIVLGWVMWFARLPISDPVSRDVSIVARTGINREVMLPDGSAVALAAGSRLTMRFKDSERNVFLERGEAFFQVKKDRHRPFIVHALHSTVKAVGTAFNVRAEEGRVHVAVTEGAVEIERPAAERVRLRAGHEVALAPDIAEPKVATVDARNATAWMQGTLRFVNEPLSSVVAAVNRYSNVPVTLEDSALGARHYTGTVVASRIDEWLRGLPDVFPVKVEDRGAAGMRIESRFTF